MPTYEYKCQNCGRKFETVLNILEHDDSRPQCPQCKSKKVEQVVSDFFAETDRKI